MIDLCWKDIYAPSGRFILYLSCKLGLYLYKNAFLVCFEGNECGDAGALDCDGNLSLVLRASARHAAGQDLSALADEFTEFVGLLIVDRALFLAEEADLLEVLLFEAAFCGTVALVAFAAGFRRLWRGSARVRERVRRRSRPPNSGSSP